MTQKPDGERLAFLEATMTGVNKKLDALDMLMSTLHIKMDTLTTTFNDNFVAKREFEEWKRSRSIERVVLILFTAIISSLVTFWVYQNNR